MQNLSDLLGVSKLDGPLNSTANKLKPRWPKSTSENSTSSSFLGQSLNVSQISMSFSKSPGRSKTPKTTPGRHERHSNSNSRRKTPGGKTPKKTPTVTPSWGDRFIPSRSGTDYNLSHFLVTQNDDNEGANPIEQEKQRIMGETLHGRDLHSQRVLEFKNKVQIAPEGHVNSTRSIYTNSKTPTGLNSSARMIPSNPEKVLDAPDIMDDYYLNLVDWGKHNILAVALRNAVYLWNETTGRIQQLMELPSNNDYVCSVSWVEEGNVLAIGDVHGAVQLWDCNVLKQLRTMRSHSGRVGALSWNRHICTSGSRTGAIHHSDVRSGNFLVGEVHGHTQEICGLKWCPDGNYLASGSNDNLLNIWARAPPDFQTQSLPLYSFSDHQAAVKALAWCPWQHYLLASGGGTADRHIRFWNIRLGTPVHAIDTKSQICSILWSPHYKELISGHGYANHEITVWKYPSMEKITDLVGHTQRVLNLSLSPDGTTVMSAGADETIRLWKVFQISAAKRKAITTTTKTACSSLSTGLR